jgi:hypothetical protein
MEVDDVEVASVFRHLLQHQDVMRQIVAAIRIRSDSGLLVIRPEQMLGAEINFLQADFWLAPSGA